MEDILNKIDKIAEQVLNFLTSVNYKYISISATIMIALTVILFATIVYKLVKQEQEEQNFKKSFDERLNKMVDGANNRLKSSKSRGFNYGELKLYISKSGLKYMTNGKMTPLIYVLTKILMAMFIMFLGMQENILIGLILMPFGYNLLDFIINESDKSDNKHMLNDIKAVYDTLRIQTKAGVYITSVLVECYLVIKNKRLKKAMLKLTSDIIAKNNMDDALDEFKDSFNNEYIDTLVIIIKQSMVTGQAVKMFEDIKDQIKDIDAAMVINDKAKINAKTIMVQVLMYCAIILVAVFITFTSLSSGLGF